MIVSLIFVFFSFFFFNLKFLVWNYFLPFHAMFKGISKLHKYFFLLHSMLVTSICTLPSFIDLLRKPTMKKFHYASVSFHTFCWKYFILYCFFLNMQNYIVNVMLVWFFFNLLNFFHNHQHSCIWILLHW